MFCIWSFSWLSYGNVKFVKNVEFLRGINRDFKLFLRRSSFQDEYSVFEMEFDSSHDTQSLQRTDTILSLPSNDESDSSWQYNVYT